MLYDKVSTDMNFVERENQVEKFWKENDTFNKSVKENEGHPMYMFYDGPPTANGKPHIGHVLTRAVKDMIPRYHSMKGRKFREKPAGIPTAFRWRSRLKRRSASRARIRSRNMGLNLSSKNAKSPYGNIKACGNSFPTRSDSGLTWSIRMLPITTTILSRNGGR